MNGLFGTVQKISAWLPLCWANIFMSDILLLGEWQFPRIPATLVGYKYDFTPIQQSTIGRHESNEMESSDRCSFEKECSIIISQVAEVLGVHSEQRLQLLNAVLVVWQTKEPVTSKVYVVNKKHSQHFLLHSQRWKAMMNGFLGIEVYILKCLCL